MKKSLHKLTTTACIFAYVCLTAVTMNAQEVSIETTKLSDSVYMLKGSGGHIGLSIGEDGVVMIDDQFAPLSDKIKAAVAAITEQPIKYVINTHWHGDHVGGNKNFADSGSVIVAHDNVRERMSKDQFMEMFKREVKAAPKEALPVITFTEAMTFHLNGDDIRVIHVPYAHTDGDAIIHFVNDNIIHTGDTVFSGTYPFIDTGSGGSIKGFLANLKRIMSMADENTKIIPGHGPLTDKAGIATYHAVLSDIYANYRALKAEGKTLEEMQAIGISKKYDEQYGKGFIKPDVFLKLIHSSKDYAKDKKLMMRDKLIEESGVLDNARINPDHSDKHHHGGDQSAHRH